MEEVVKTPAIEAPGATRASITSVRPAYLTPAAAEANSTPAISGRSGNFAGASGEIVSDFALVCAAEAAGAGAVERSDFNALTLARSFLTLVFNSLVSFDFFFAIAPAF